MKFCKVKAICFYFDTEPAVLTCSRAMEQAKSRSILPANLFITVNSNFEFATQKTYCSNKKKVSKKYLQNNRKIVFLFFNKK